MVKRIDGYTLQEASLALGLGKTTLYTLRGRHEDFPGPRWLVGPSGEPRYALEDLRAWLLARGTISE